MRVYVNGEVVAQDEARVSVDDRGFLFADGVYDVARIYDGRIFLLDHHLARLRRGLEALRIPVDDLDELGRIATRLVEENGLGDQDGIVYWQVTRGAAPRVHRFPTPQVAPGVYVAARPYPRPPASAFEEGVPVITVPDIRWARCDIKSIGLLANVLANEQAHAAGAFEALFVRDGIVLEGTHSNVLAVYDGEIVTYPATNYILAGITRQVVFELASEVGVPIREGPITLERFFDADEVFLSGTTTEVMPVVRVDGRRIGTGRPGPITRRLVAGYGRRF